VVTFDRTSVLLHVLQNFLQKPLLKLIVFCSQGWEEIVDTALTHQLRTTLSKSAKDQSVNSEMLSIGTETSKLKKHIAIFIERLAKGAKLSSSDPDESELCHACQTL